MKNLIILACVVVVLGFLVQLFQAKGKSGNKIENEEKPKYQYIRKDFVMTPVERECYVALVSAVGDTYDIFPQVHLPSILEHKINGQDWKPAFSHISQKSMDYILCNKSNLLSRLAIELDDKSHEQEARKERDIEVERMLAAANFPLLRLENHGSFNPVDLKKRIEEKING